MVARNWGEAVARGVTVVVSNHPRRWRDVREGKEVRMKLVRVTWVVHQLQRPRGDGDDRLIGSKAEDIYKIPDGEMVEDLEG